ncbi:hypothetical protein [Isoptericola rhizosphaerae]|uniref:hypothetical protein n=1 Tax=Isoptericola rhizosphaerae TaxID=3377837 RepID=UPI00383A3759
MVLVVMAVLGIGAVAWFATRPGTPTSSTATPSASPAPVGSYRVAAGEGGTTVASDGRTPVGYEQSCEGAVAAATNYSAGIWDATFQGQMSEEQFVAYLTEINGGLDDGATTGDEDSPLAALVTEFATIRADATEMRELGIDFDPDGQLHPEWGGFLVQSCTSGGQATVQVLGYSDSHLGEGGVGGYEAVSATVAWVGGDWRLIERVDLNNDDLPEGYLDVEVAPVSAADRRAWITTAGPGWTEYTNAPQD